MQHCIVHVDCVIPPRAYLVEVQLIKQIHKPFVLALLTKHSVMLDQSVQSQLGLVIYVHLHWLQCMSCWSASQNLDITTAAQDQSDRQKQV